MAVIWGKPEALLAVVANGLGEEGDTSESDARVVGVYILALVLDQAEADERQNPADQV